MAKELYPRVYLYRRVVQAKLFMDKHFAEAIDLRNTADEAFFSKFHFLRLFKKIYGRTPHQYLTRVRVNNAKVLLSSGRAVSDVCFAVGFDSVTSFTGLFKKLTGLTPSAYQKVAVQRKADMRTMPLKFIPNCFAESKGWVQKEQF